MSWKPEAFVDGEWVGNALAFATKKEADLWGSDLLQRWWFVPSDSRSVESDEKVNYLFDVETHQIKEVNNA